MSFSLIEDFLNKAPSNDKYYKIECLIKSYFLNNLQNIVILCDKDIKFKHDSVGCLDFFVKENSSLFLNYTNSSILHFDIREDKQMNFVIIKFPIVKNVLESVEIFKNLKCEYEDLQYMLNVNGVNGLEKCSLEIENATKIQNYTNDTYNVATEYVYNIMSKILMHKEIIIPNIRTDDSIYRIYSLPKYKYDKFIRILRTVFEKDFV